MIAWAGTARRAPKSTMSPSNSATALSMAATNSSNCLLRSLARVEPALQRRGKVLRIHRLGEKLVHPRGDALIAVFLEGAGGQGDDRQAGAAASCSHSRMRTVASKPSITGIWQSISTRSGRMPPVMASTASWPFSTLTDHVAGLDQQGLDHLAVDRDCPRPPARACRAVASLPPRRTGGSAARAATAAIPRRRRRPRTDAEPEAGALAQPRSRRRRRRPSARPGVRRWTGRGRCRRICRVLEPSTWENGWNSSACLSAGDADAGVGHGEFEQGVAAVAADLRRRLDADAALRRELDGVADQIGQHLPQAHAGRPGSAARRAVPCALQLQALCRAGSANSAAFPRAPGPGIEGGARQLELAGLDLGQVEDVVEQRQQGLAGVEDGAGIFAAAPPRSGPASAAVAPCRECRSSACGSRATWWRGSGSWPGWRPRRPPWPGQRRLGLLALGDVGVGGDETAMRQRCAAHFEGDAVRPHPLENVRLRVAGLLHHRGRDLRRVARAILAALGVVADHRFQRRAVARQQALGKFEHTIGLGIVGHQHQRRVGQRQAAGQVVDDGLQRVMLALQLEFGGAAAR